MSHVCARFEPPVDSMRLGLTGSKKAIGWRPLIRPLVLALAIASLGRPASGQSVLDRTPNVDGTWTGQSGTLFFNFLHRFTTTGRPNNKVINVPTFTLAFGAPGNTLFGFRHATNSQVAGVPNEWEFFGRINPLSERRNAPIDLSLHGGWSQSAESFDGELAIARSFGRLRLLGAGRVMSNAYGQDAVRYAVAGGIVLRLTPSVALAGDYGSLLDRSSSEDAAWGAGLQLRIPYTPHTLSLQVVNTNSATIEGSSIDSGETRYGFEFTIPLTLSRYIGRRAAVTSGPAVQATGDTVRIAMQSLAYQTARLEIARGTTVIWENRDAVAHTSTSDDGRWDSGLIEGGRSWARTFGEAGTFAYHCTPHPFMKAVIVVR
jgi:plastocyanin